MNNLTQAVLNSNSLKESTPKGGSHAQLQAFLQPTQSRTIIEEPQIETGVVIAPIKYEQESPNAEEKTSLGLETEIENLKQAKEDIEIKLAQKLKEQAELEEKLKVAPIAKEVPQAILLIPLAAEETVKINEVPEGVTSKIQNPLAQRSIAETIKTTEADTKKPGILQQIRDLMRNPLGKSTLATSGPLAAFLISIVAASPSFAESEQPSQNSPSIEIPLDNAGNVIETRETPDMPIPEEILSGEVEQEKTAVEVETASTTLKNLAERPENIDSIHDLRKWLNETGRLQAFESILLFGEEATKKIEREQNTRIEPTLDGTARMRPYWLQTMLLQPVKNMLPSNANNRPDLTYKYRNFVRAAGGKVKMLNSLDDNSFESSSIFYETFDAFYKKTIVSTMQALEDKMTDQEKLDLANILSENRTTAEYLTEVMRLGDKYNVERGQIPRISDAYLNQVIENTNGGATQKSELEEENTPELAIPDEVLNASELEPTQQTYWAQYALEAAELYGIQNGEGARYWANGPFNSMITQYKNENDIMQVNGIEYTKQELLFLKNLFTELKSRKEKLGNIYGRNDYELDQVNRVLNDIEGKLQGK